VKVNISFEYDLSSPDERLEYEELTSENHKNLKLAMWNFSQNVLRHYRKYGDLVRDAKIDEENDSSAEIAAKTLELINDLFYESLDEEGARIE